MHQYTKVVVIVCYCYFLCKDVVDEVILKLLKQS